MKIGLLRRLRREAHKKYGIEYWPQCILKYSVGTRYEYIRGVRSYKDFADLDNAKKYLFKLRYDFIIKKVHELRNKSENESISKQVSKL